MQVVYGDDCVDMSTVCRWAKNVRMAKFKALICVINGEVVKWTIFDSSW
jgi:hypothetical protein